MLPSPHRGAAERRAPLRAESTGVFWGCHAPAGRMCKEVPALDGTAAPISVARGTWVGAGQEKRSGLFSVRRSLSLARLCCPPRCPAPGCCGSAIHLPPHRGGGLLSGPLLSSAPHEPLYLRGSGEGMGPYAGVSPRPLSTQQSWWGRSQGGGLGKAKFGVPRTTRGRSSEQYSLPIPVSCRSGPCDLVSMLEAWGALASTQPQPPPQAKEQRRQRPGPKSLKRQTLPLPRGHAPQLSVTNEHHTCLFLLDYELRDLGSLLARPVFPLTLTPRIGRTRVRLPGSSTQTRESSGPFSNGRVRRSPGGGGCCGSCKGRGRGRGVPGLDVELGRRPLLSPLSFPQTLWMSRCRGSLGRQQSPVPMGKPRAGQALGGCECEQKWARVT